MSQLTILTMVASLSTLGAILFHASLTRVIALSRFVSNDSLLSQIQIAVTADFELNLTGRFSGLPPCYRIRNQIGGCLTTALTSMYERFRDAGLLVRVH